MFFWETTTWGVTLRECAPTWVYGGTLPKLSFRLQFPNITQTRKGKERERREKRERDKKKKTNAQCTMKVCRRPLSAILQAMFVSDSGQRVVAHALCQKHKMMCYNINETKRSDTG